MSFISKLFGSGELNKTAKDRNVNAVNPKEKPLNVPTSQVSDKAVEPDVSNQVTEKSKPEPPEPAPVKYIEGTTIALLGERVVGFDDETVTHIGMPNGSTFWAKNFYVGMEKSRVSYIDFALDGTASVQTQYGVIQFSGDSLRVADDVVTQGCASNSIQIVSPDGIKVSLTSYLTFYHPGGNIESGYLAESLKVNGAEIPKNTKVTFPEDGNLSYISVNNKNKLIQLKELNLDETALFDAIKENNPEKVKQIFTTIHTDKTSLSEIKDSDNRIPLHIALDFGLTDMATCLKEIGFDINQINTGGDTALHTFSSTGNRNLVQWLLDHQANVNLKNDSGVTPLFAAVHHYHLDIAEMLLNAGADINATDDDDNLVIYELIEDLTLGIEKKAKLESGCSLVKMLVNKGIAINRKNNCGESSFMKMCSAKYPELVDLMLSKGAEINDRDNNSETPLFYAVRAGNIRITEMLVTAGVEVNTVNEGGEYPLELAFNDQMVEIVQLLLQHGADVSCLPEDADLGFQHLDINKRLLDAAMHGNHEVIEALLNKGADINTISEMGYTPLMWSVMKDYYIGASRLLMEAGANLNIQNHKGDTALLIALKESSGNTAELLIDNGADIHIQGNGSGFPEIPVALAAYKGYQDIVLKMINQGADVNAQCKDGETALSLAKSMGHNPVVELLLAHGATK